MEKKITKSITYFNSYSILGAKVTITVWDMDQIPISGSLR